MPSAQVSVAFRPGECGIFGRKARRVVLKGQSAPIFVLVRLRSGARLFIAQKSLSQFSLTEERKCGSDLFFRAVTSQVSSTYWSLTSVFGMGTGGTSRLLPPQWVNFFVRDFRPLRRFPCALTTAYELFFRDLSAISSWSFRIN